MLFFRKHPDVGWAYWAINGAKWVNASQMWEDETFGILEMDYSALRQPWMLAGRARPSTRDPKPRTLELNPNPWSNRLRIHTPRVRALGEHSLGPPPPALCEEFLFNLPATL